MLDDGYVVKDGSIYNNINYSPRLELLSIDEIEDSSQPFLKYDEMYNHKAEVVATMEFNDRKAKLYFLSEKIIASPIGLYSTYIYCIEIDGKMVVMSFFKSYLENVNAVEEILNSIEMK